MHGCLLQLRDSVVLFAGHKPTAVRSRVWVPVPHPALQLFQIFHSEYSQSGPDTNTQPLCFLSASCEHLEVAGLGVVETWCTF